MNLSSCMLISILLSSICTVIISGESANSKKKSAKKEEKQVPIDDLEGSGFEDTRTDTMVYSGSGYGPQGPEDDEDTSNYSPTDTATKIRTGIFTDEKSTNDANKDKDTNEQTLPMPVPKSTAAPTTSTKAPEPPVVEINTKEQEQDIIPKIAVEQDPVDTKTSGTADKSPIDDTVSNNNGVYVINTPERDRTTSFFAQPGILAAVIGGAVVGLLCAILVVMFIVYRMRKKDEGSYPLEEMKRCPATNPYIKPNHREFFA